jgi:hypothetical protein
MTWNGAAYGGHAYFTDQWAADDFRYQAYNGTQVLGSYMGNTIFYGVYWQIEYYSNGYWYSYSPAP